jgi:hypothetical protein
MMERSSEDATGIPEFSVVDPCDYLREADLALLYGSREQAVALIAKAYLAFDLALADCGEVMPRGKVWPGRSS